VPGLLLSPHQPWPGLYDGQGGEPGAPRSRQARPAAGVEAGGAADAGMPPPRAGIAGAHRGWGRAGSSLDWPDAHHERGRKRWGVKKAGDQVAHRRVPSQTVVTAGLANRPRLDGLEVLGQQPQQQEEALAYLHETGRER
jgi:hypothetical protein